MLSRCVKICERKIFTPPVLQVLSLDARNTILKLKENPSVVYSRFARKNGIEINSESLFPHFLKNYKRMSVSHSCFGWKSIGEQRWWREVVQSSIVDCAPNTSQDVAAKVADELFDHYATAEPWQLVESDVKSTLQKFRLKGISLVVVSNFDSRLKQLLTSFDLYDLFSMIVLSGEVGVEKPDFKIFDLVFRHFQVPHASQILHIGDDVRNDYLGAKNYGSKALLFDPANSCSEVPSIDVISSLSSLELY